MIIIDFGYYNSWIIILVIRLGLKEE